jgi:hypothetical protein
MGATDKRKLLHRLLLGNVRTEEEIREAVYLFDGEVAAKPTRFLDGCAARRRGRLVVHRHIGRPPGADAWRTVLRRLLPKRFHWSLWTA